MTSAELEFLCSRTGLETVWKLYPEEIRAAVLAAAQTSKVLDLPRDTMAEPWPPYRTALNDG